MPNAITYEYLKSIEGVANGLATLDTNTQVPTSELPVGQPNGVASLDDDGKVPLSQLPPISSMSNFKGTFADETVLATDFPVGVTGDYAYVTSTLSYWYWNNELVTPSWVNQEITLTDYNLLSAEQKGQVPYILVV